MEGQHRKPDLSASVNVSFWLKDKTKSARRGAGFWLHVLTCNAELCEEEPCKQHTHTRTSTHARTRAPSLQRAPWASHEPNPDLRLLQVKFFLCNNAHSLSAPVISTFTPQWAFLKVSFKPLHHAALLIHLSLTFPGHVVLQSPLTAMFPVRPAPGVPLL